MKDYRAYFLFILLFSFSGFINAQNFSRQLSWPEKPMSDYQISEEQGNYIPPHLRLEAQEAFLLYPVMIPYYSEVIPIHSDMVDVRFYNVRTEPLTAAERKLLSSADMEVVSSQAKSTYSVGNARGQYMLQIAMPALRKNSATGDVEKVISFDFTINPSTKATVEVKAEVYPNSSVLAQGFWKQISVTKSGIYKITYEELVAMGFSNVKDISLWGHDGRQLPFMNRSRDSLWEHDDRQPSFINRNDVIYDLKQIPVWTSGSSGGLGAGDYILFYANGPVTWELESGDSLFTHHIHDYSSSTTYFLTTQFSSPERIGTLDEPSAAHTRISNSYDALHYFENNEVNLVQTGRQWFGDSFDASSTRSYSLPFNNPVSGGKAYVRIRVAARSSVSSSLSVSANNSPLGNIPLGSVNVGSQTARYATASSRTFKIPYSQGNLNLQLTYNKPSPAARAWLDFITVNARQKLTMQGAQLLFRDTESVGADKITRFDIANASSDLMVWDVTDFFERKKRVPYHLTNNVAQAKLRTETLRELIAFTPSQAYSIGSVEDVVNQNIHGTGQPQMVIVTHPDYLSQSNELAQLHRDYSGLSVAVFTNQQVYNEFSSGTPDVAAIRNMMRMFYKRASNTEELPRYLLLMGDGSYDNKSRDVNNTNKVLTYQSIESLSPTESFVSDDFFGLLDDGEGEGTGLLDIGVGRIPCNTTAEANTALAKIKEYMMGQHGGWHNQFSFIGDDGDNNLHMRQADELATFIETRYLHYNVERIFFDAYPMEISSDGARYPDVTTAINSRMNQGALVVNYVGHANTQVLAHEKVIMVHDILQWRNFERLPLFVTATCEFSRFDDPKKKSGGEHVLLAPKGGAVALFSTTRVVFASPNHTLTTNFFKNTFEQRPDYVEGESDRYYRLGDLIRLAKNATVDELNKRNFMLLGDPALMLHYPDKGMGVTSLNGKIVTEPLDTLKALSRVEIEGEVLDLLKGEMEFMGEAEITLFDKIKEITTLANTGNDPFVFNMRESTVYKGRSSVLNGKFTSQFIIPKDIMYEYGGGRISLYASDGSATAAGYFENFTIGGISDSIGNDIEGPQIEIYMNNEKFVPGGYTDANPKLLVILADSSGINTTGAGIGHDLTAEITGAEEQTIILNDFYISDLDDYTRGKVTYQLSDLQGGRYTVKVKAWDVYNNSSEEEIDFIVQSDEKLKLSHVINYPNPFTETTGFYFEHNWPFSEFDILIQIFSPSGKLVKTLDYYFYGDGSYRVGPIFWDGLDDYGDSIGRGVYFYKLSVKPVDGKAVEVYQKLVILK